MGPGSVGPSCDTGLSRAWIILTGFLMGTAILKGARRMKARGVTPISPQAHYIYPPGMKPASGRRRRALLKP
jgi:hypothetical protein